ncbi:MAG TPA: D-alanyl-D-alanine carboxypeptidase family protein, partial [Burkholderiales bacterium]|nr:D-alanyl-D-alanine carboxypeptidase family protein [Burkholderiales bacterium]
MECPEHIRAILAELGISTDVIAARQLPFCAEPAALDLAEVGDDGREYRLTPQAAVAWRRMKEAAAAEGVVLRLISAFRSIDRQVEILREKLAEGATLDEILS